MAAAAAVSDAAAVSKVKKNQRNCSWDYPEGTVPLLLDPRTSSSGGRALALQNMSISPWIYSTTFEDSLDPPHLSEARCLLRGCLNMTGQEDQNLESRPIMRQVQLLRRVRMPAKDSAHNSNQDSAQDSVQDSAQDSARGFRYLYRLETRLVAVGCTCVRPPVRVQH
ncbi:unnamed protein product [Ophioblennius macclurei]